jgi:hypothetical protein
MPSARATPRLARDAYRMHRLRRGWVLSLAVAVSLTGGCFHYVFDQRAPRPEEALTRHAIRVPTWLNGFVGTGRVDTTRYCAQPIRTELQVRATDVLISLLTLLIYTPHTLYVTCPRSA